MTHGGRLTRGKGRVAVDGRVVGKNEFGRPRRIAARLLLVAAMVASIQVTTMASPAAAKSGVYRLNIIRVIYSDTTSTPYSLDQLKAVPKEIHDYFEKLSYGTLDVKVQVKEIKIEGTQSFYWDPCATDGTESRSPCPPRLTSKAVFAAATSGMSFAGVDGISILNPWCAKDFTNAEIALSFIDTTVKGSYQISADFECPVPIEAGAPGPSGVFWGGWAHELGHQLQNAQFGGPGFDLWGGHPSGYSSGYDLMDSCYPCHDSLFALSGPPVVNGGKRLFDWLPSGSVMTVEPDTGTTTIQVRALERGPAASKVLGVKLPLAPGRYYLVEARQRVGTDAGSKSDTVGPGIWDEGIHILEVEDTRDPPVRPVQPCDAKKTCVGTKDPGFAENCDTIPRPKIASDAAVDCWPHRLWHVGDTFTDTDDNVDVHVEAATADGYTLTIGRKALRITPEPWTHPPITYHKPVSDLWIDSSCNGYEADVGPAGLRFGRDNTNSVHGTGDIACASHENRLYLHVQNRGTGVARNIAVTFEVRRGVGIAANDWVAAGTASETEFPSLAALAPGQSAEVFVPWMAPSSLQEPDIARDHYNSTLSVRARIGAVEGETVVTDNETDAIVAPVEAVVDAKSGGFLLPTQSFTLRNPFDESTLAMLEIQSRLPDGLGLSVSSGQSELQLRGQEERQVLVSVEVQGKRRARAAAGKSYLVSVSALHEVLLQNPEIGPGWPQTRGVSDTHKAVSALGTVLYDVRAVSASSLSIRASSQRRGFADVTGQTKPAVAHTVVAIDWTDAAGLVKTRMAKTDARGRFHDSIATSDQERVASVRAIWQGTLVNSSAVSEQVSLN